MSNPFVLAVMKALGDKLQKPETERAKDEAREEERSSSPKIPAPSPQQRRD
jgi:hypothetical protein